MTVVKEVLNSLIVSNKGPWKDYSPESGQDCRKICEAVADEILNSITGIYPGCDVMSVEYDFMSEIWIYLTFQNRATHTAQQIAEGFRNYAGVSVNVKVWECVSEYARDKE